MSKQTYVPTEADRLTGENVRKLRRLAGETLIETIERSGVKIKQSSLSRVELGQRQLSMPEATKLAAHWNTSADRLFVKAPQIETETVPGTNWPVIEGWPIAVETEQQFLGNAPTLFAVPEPAGSPIVAAGPNAWIKIDTNAPMTPEQYRADVWIPYLENRYNNEQKAS